MRQLISIVLLVLLTGLSTNAQNKGAVRSFQKAVNAFSLDKNDEGWRFLELAIKKSDDGYYQPLIYAGDRAAKEGNYAKALAFYNDAIEKQPLSSLFLKRSRIYKYRFDWDKAIADYERFLDQARLSNERRKTAEEELANLKFGKLKYQEFQAAGATVAIEKLTFSDDKMEYFPCITGDAKSLLFTARDLDAPSTDENLWIGKRAGKAWESRALPLKGYLNSRGNEGAASISADGSKMIFTACDRPDGKGSCDLYQSTFDPSNGWGKPVLLSGKVNTGAWESQPSLAPDGRTLFFVRGRHSQSTDLDIYMARLDDEGNWSDVEALPRPVNTNRRESSPFIHFDGRTLYFTSERSPSIGGSDFFKSERLSDTSWSKPENLGFPINGFADEFSFIVDHTGTTGYFASNRERWNEPPSAFGNGLDLYEFSLPEAIRPNATSYINAQVVNASTMAPLSSVQVSVYDIDNGQHVFNGYSAIHTGQFRPMLAPGKTYGFTANKKGYLPYSERLRAVGDEQDLLVLKMQPLVKGSTFVLNNIYFDLDKSELLPQSTDELNVLLEVLKNEPELSATIIGHTDNQGSQSYNEKLSLARAQAVVSYLTSLGISESRLSAVGKGMNQPIDTNETEEGRAKNRRTEVQLN